MFSDIEDLSKEIEEFKSNIQENIGLFEVLQKVSEDINKSKEDLDIKYSYFLKELLEVNKKIEMQNNEIFEKNIKTIDNQKGEIEKKFVSIVNEINNQQLVFEKSSTNIIERLEKLELDSLVKSIDKVSRKINIIYMILGIITIINIIIIILK